MADEIRSGPEGLTTDDPEQARAEIAMTRARMSETIDEIEDALLRRKERIQDRLDIFSTVRERPLPAAGIAFGAGLVLGLLTGGSDDEDDDYEVEVEFEDGFGGSLSASARADLWESRARRLLDIARQQRDGYSLAVDDDEAWDEDDEDDDGAFAGLRSTVEERVRPLVSGMIRHFLDGNRRS